MGLRPASDIDSYSWKRRIILTWTIAMVLLTAFLDERAVMIFLNRLNDLKVSIKRNVIQTCAWVEEHLICWELKWYVSNACIINFNCPVIITLYIHPEYSIFCLILNASNLGLCLILLVYFSFGKFDYLIIVAAKVNLANELFIGDDETEHCPWNNSFLFELSHKQLYSMWIIRVNFFRTQSKYPITHQCAQILSFKHSHKVHLWSIMVLFCTVIIQRNKIIYNMSFNISLSIFDFCWLSWILKWWWFALSVMILWALVVWAIRRWNPDPWTTSIKKQFQGLLMSSKV